MKLDAVVVLNTMWDWESRTTDFVYKELAPRWYTINPDNKSGKLLYTVLGDKKFLVTNACKELVVSPNHRGKPDPNYLAHNLTLLLAYDYRLLLVCGKVAWDTYIKSGFNPSSNYIKRRVIRMKHPAARDWTKQEVERWRKYLEK